MRSEALPRWLDATPAEHLLDFKQGPSAIGFLVVSQAEGLFEAVVLKGLPAARVCTSCADTLGSAGVVQVLVRPARAAVPRRTDGRAHAHTVLGAAGNRRRAGRGPWQVTAAASAALRAGQGTPARCRHAPHRAVALSVGTHSFAGAHHSAVLADNGGSFWKKNALCRGGGGAGALKLGWRRGQDADVPPGARGVLQQVLNFSAPTLLVGGLELGLWNFAASSTQALGLEFTTATRAAFLIQATALLTPLLASLSGERPGRAVWCAAGPGTLNAA